jgi:prepilin-type N-terminal cleavage/methylation domain-containing protein
LRQASLIVRRVRSSHGDEGMSLVEMMIAVFIISVGLLALAGELAANLHGQVADKRQAIAVRLATTTLEDARRLTYHSLTLSAGNQSQTTSQSGTAYTAATSVEVCSATDPAGTCTTPGSGAASDVRVVVTVSWDEAGHTRHVSLASNLGDTSSTVDQVSGSGTMASLLGGTGTSTLSVVLGALTLAPSTAAVNSNGNPASAVVATLNVTGLDTSTVIPLTWSDDNGSHQTTMTSATSTTWTATIAANNIKAVIPSDKTSSTVTFAATVPGGGVATKKLTVVSTPTFVGNCTVTPNPIVLKVLTTNTQNAETLSCTTTGLASSDSVTVSYPTGVSTTANGTLTSANGTNWSLVLPANTKLKGAPSEVFTFSLQRLSDGQSGTPQNITVLAA